MVGATAEIYPQLIEQVQTYLAQRADHCEPDSQNAAAWEAFYEACAPWIERYVIAQGVPAHNRDDCVQEVWLQLMRYIQRLQYDPKRGMFRTWLYTLTRSASADEFRRQKRTRQNLNRFAQQAPTREEVPDPLATLTSREARHEAELVLQTAREVLSPVNYQLFYMRCVQQRSVEHVALKLKLSAQQVWFRQHRIKKKLRSLLAEQAS